MVSRDRNHDEIIGVVLKQGSIRQFDAGSQIIRPNARPQWNLISYDTRAPYRERSSLDLTAYVTTWARHGMAMGISNATCALGTK